MNTNLHATRPQLETLLRCVRLARGDRVDVPAEERLYGAEQMLLAALERIRDLDAKRAAR